MEEINIKNEKDLRKILGIGDKDLINSNSGLVDIFDVKNGYISYGLLIGNGSVKRIKVEDFLNKWDLMEKLKTLKEIKENHFSGSPDWDKDFEYVDYLKLKELGIKWIKHFRKVKEDGMKKNDFGSYPNPSECMFAIDIIKTMFDIPEEDLKKEKSISTTILDLKNEFEIKYAREPNCCFLTPEIKRLLDFSLNKTNLIEIFGLKIIIADINRVGIIEEEEGLK